eukprot:jgi/Tetstr1/443484/TSEL_031492.t1
MEVHMSHIEVIAAATEGDAAHHKRLMCKQSGDSASPQQRKRQRPASTSSGSSGDTFRVHSSRPIELHLYVERLHLALEHCLVEGLSAEEAMNNLSAEGWHPGAVHVLWSRLEAENPEFFARYNTHQRVSQRRNFAACHAQKIESALYSQAFDDEQCDAGVECDADESDSSSC